MKDKTKKTTPARTKSKRHLKFIRIESQVRLLVFMVFLNSVSAAHYIVGYVNDARDGTDSENHTIMAWNPSNGVGENIIGSIGKDGQAGQEAMYMLDCEALQNG